MTGAVKKKQALAAPTGRRRMVKLLRFLIAGERRIDRQADACRLAGHGGESLSVEEEELRALAQSGLVTLSENASASTPAARAHLKRLLSEEGGEAFAAQHRDLETVHLPEPGESGSRKRAVLRNRAESPLYPLRPLKDRSGEPFLSEDDMNAGERLAADFERAGLQPRITASWEPRLSSRIRGQAPRDDVMTDMAIGAHRRLSAAIDAMGPDLSGVALDVCCFGKGLELVERERQWPARSAKLMLRVALLALARHYQPPPTRKGTRHWGERDYRPPLS